ncbi:MAG: 50S ribosomal protein L21 [Clostridiales bacterium]|nr:50S ribosomal protein L21 [Clostridiales bacterium]
MYAVIASGGKQQKVMVGDTIYVEKIDKKDGTKVNFDTLLYANGDDILIGAPIVKNVTVIGKIVKQVRSKKVIVFKYKAKKNIRKKNGHRQPYTAVEITAIKKAEKKASVKKTEAKTEATPIKKALVKKTEAKATAKPKTVKKPVKKVEAE